jgi:hypothetical protein
VNGRRSLFSLVGSEIATPTDRGSSVGLRKTHPAEGN